MKKHFSDKANAAYLEELANRFEKLDEFSETSAEDATRELSASLNVKPAKLIHPTRLAVSGMTFGPGLFELLILVGRDISVKRMRKAADFILNYDD